eukprot:Sspe_Gene.61198::Locus_33899_Transcript_1_1_Confidence_1.000_Length_967::g.61198::m.61198
MAPFEAVAVRGLGILNQQGRPVDVGKITAVGQWNTCQQVPHLMLGNDSGELFRCVLTTHPVKFPGGHPFGGAVMEEWAAAHSADGTAKSLHASSLHTSFSASTIVDRSAKHPPKLVYRGGYTGGENPMAWGMIQSSTKHPLDKPEAVLDLVAIPALSCCLSLCDGKVLAFSMQDTMYDILHLAVLSDRDQRFLEGVLHIAVKKQWGLYQVASATSSKLFVHTYSPGAVSSAFGSFVVAHSCDLPVEAVQLAWGGDVVVLAYDHSSRLTQKGRGYLTLDPSSGQVTNRIMSSDAREAVLPRFVPSPTLDE